MVRVSEEQLDFILGDIAAHGIETEDLKENLLDHICCIVENEMNTEDDFYEFYERILPRFFTDELREIQEETDKLLTFKDYYAMKNTLVKSGLISAALTLLGVFFKVMHWPGASVMLVLGIATFGLLFIPLLIVLKFKDEEEPIDKWVLSIGLGLGVVASVGILFKIMHWPSANILVYSSLALFVLVYVPTYFLTKFRRAELKFNTTVNSVLMMACGCLLFAVFGMGNSHAHKNYATPTHSFLFDNVEKMNEANVAIASDIEDFSDVDGLHNKSRKLFSLIDEVKSNLIAKLEGVSKGQAETYSTIDLKDPDNYVVVLNHFVHAKGDLSLKNLQKEIAQYNELVVDKYPNRAEKVLSLDKLQLERSSISILLSELTQIQLQLATTESAYLSELSK